jgi:purine-nucleoside phosphorylase
MTESSPNALTAVRTAADYINPRISQKPRLGMILGSGLGRLADKLEAPTIIPYSEIPGMPCPGVAGHSGTLSLGKLNHVPMACLRGRVHLYEGHSPETVVFGARLLALLGCEIVVLTNAAGATSQKDVPGSVLVISDHLNLTGKNPLVGFRRPTTFLDMTNAYDVGLRSIAKSVALEHNIVIREGVYAGLVGPNYETCAEVAYLSKLGADAVGMSTVLETLALRDLGVKVFALSCITNAAAGVPGAILDHAHVQAVADQGAERIEQLLLGWVAKVFAS